MSNYPSENGRHQSVRNGDQSAYSRAEILLTNKVHFFDWEKGK